MSCRKTGFKRVGNTQMLLLSNPGLRRVFHITFNKQISIYQTEDIIIITCILAKDHQNDSHDLEGEMCKLKKKGRKIII